MRRQRHRIRPAMQTRRQHAADREFGQLQTLLPEMLNRISDGLRRISEDPAGLAAFQNAVTQWGRERQEITMKEFNPNVIDPPQ